MTNAELILINEISKIPKSKDAKFFIELEHLDKHCYIPNHIPIYEDDFYNSILRVPGNMFKYDSKFNTWCNTYCIVYILLATIIYIYT